MTDPVRVVELHEAGLGARPGLYWAKAWIAARAALAQWQAPAPCKLRKVSGRDQRIAALEGEVERLRDANGVDIYIADAEAAEARAAAAEGDAQRYRWLREQSGTVSPASSVVFRKNGDWANIWDGASLDNAIDTRIAEYAAIAAGDAKPD